MKCLCKQCGKEFELSEEEISFYRKKNLNLPKRCKECRQENKQKHSDRMQGGQRREAGSPKAQPAYQETPNHSDKRNKKWIYALIALIVLLFAGGAGVWRHGSLTENDVIAPAQSDTAYIDRNQSVDAVDSEEEQSTDAADSEEKQSTDAADSEEEQSTDTADTEEKQSTDAADSEEKQSTDTADTGMSQDIGAAEPEAGEESATKQYTFRNAKLLESHFQKHGVEMGFATAQEYEAAASAVVNHEDALHKLEAEDGDDVYYLEETNEFVIVSTDGFIRTYFCPDAGIEYFNRQ